MAQHDLTELLQEAREALADHPPYAADTTFAAIWQWLGRKDALLERIDAAISKERQP